MSEREQGVPFVVGLHRTRRGAEGLAAKMNEAVEAAPGANPDRCYEVQRKGFWWRVVKYNTGRVER